MLCLWLARVLFPGTQCLNITILQSRVVNSIPSMEVCGNRRLRYYDVSTTLRENRHFITAQKRDNNPPCHPVVA
ncbi:hypothetical protein BKA82DRAFT_4110870 [Pisolithus tinctorius]|nr:hypothetical protein BKA82DRAFT_4157674 [Pisolithus tinctorius]KAI6152398.1 hypothetical protein BKA82DRAFT_4110870 [Pisolithus tinctorius]